MFCTNCGAQMRDGDKFCTKCGAVAGAPSAPGGMPPMNQMPVSEQTTAGQMPVSGQTTTGQMPVTGQMPQQATGFGTPAGNTPGMYTPDMTGNMGGNITGNMAGGYNAVPQQTNSTSSGGKAGIIIAIAIVAFLIGIGGFFGVRAVLRRSFQKNQVAFVAKDGEPADGEASVAEGQSDGTAAAETEDTFAAEGTTADASADTDSAGDSASGGAFVPKDYWNELTDVQKKTLFNVLSSLYSVQSSNSVDALSVTDGMHNTITDKVIENEEDLEYLAFLIFMGPVISDQYGVDGTNSGYIDRLVVPESDMNTLLNAVFGMTFSKEGLQNKKLDRSYEQKFHEMEYANGTYTIYPGDGWAFSYAGLVKMEQISPDEVMLYGLTGDIYGTDYTGEWEYDVRKWNSTSPNKEPYGYYASNDHTFTAKAKINPESPCGLTILGMIYDDPDSGQVVREAGFSLSDSAVTGGLAQQSDAFYLLPESNLRKLTDSDIAGFDAAQLRIARNEIYARHGRKFQDEELQAYFDQQSWYRGFINPDDFTDEMLSDIERENADFLKKAEKKKK